MRTKDDDREDAYPERQRIKLLLCRIPLFWVIWLLLMQIILFKLRRSHL